MIPTKIHAYLDYIMGLFLIALPSLFYFPEGLQSLLPIVVGVGTILYSLLTDYELSVLNAITMKAHLMLDLLVGIFFTAAPWIFGFANEIYLPFVIIGVTEIMISLLTAKKRRYPAKF